MADHKNVHIFKGYNFRVLTVKGFDPVCFGCPPGIVKDFGKRGESLPSHYVLPIRTFVRGKNHFDFEFIIYTFLFARPSSDKITVYCTADQRERFISILQETLFGPTFSQMLQAQFRGFSRGAGFSPAEEKRFEAFLEGMASHQKLAGTFNRLLKNDVPDREIKSEIKVFLEPVIRRKKWLSVRVNARVLSQFAQNYLLCAQIKKEMDLFSLTEEKNQRDFIQRLVQFRLFGKDNSVT
nr:hypothetical protein [Nitrospinaceae bacterium]NIR57905.1 hypothetical protein [Nitrospinaceae bacterium]NIS88363.1 hypothetical protein [Nitrospinaceae bacterium]NIT85241.1 hypothetical protein [Nitrospinaceae bacterium]NIU47394.1 hypothetical protein [Nitrospinaceae bacterium]